MDQFNPDPEAYLKLREALHLTADTKIIGLVARFNSQKNIPGFLQAAILVAKTIPTVHFILVGKGLDVNNSDLIISYLSLALPRSA